MKTYISYVAVFLLFVLSVPVHADTIISSQEIVGNQHWTKDGSPYIITNDHVDIPEGSSLTIDPGVIVKSDNAYIQVYGTLKAEGTLEEKIHFMSIDDTQTTARGIYFYSTSGESSLKHVDVRHSQDGIYFKETSGTLSDITITDSRAGITLEGSDFHIDRFRASNVDQPLFFYEGSRATVTSSFLEKGGYGEAIYASESILALSDSEIREVGEGYAGIALSKSTSTIQNVTLDGGDADATGISASKSSVAMSSSTISHFETGIYFSDTKALITDSVIRDNSTGIEERKPGGPVVTFLESLLGIKKAFAEEEPMVTVERSVIKDNRSFGIKNLSARILKAVGNFWGDMTGPIHDALNPAGKGDRVTDNVVFDPWVGKDGDACCSSIVFIPGFQGSRLYLEDNQLWEPNRNADVEKLYLDQDGEPVIKNIHTLAKNGDRGVIDEAFGLNVYKKFLSSMDEFVASEDNKVKEFMVLPYDWRKDIDQVADELVGYVIVAAERSHNHKVTLVAHSNGGLVGKLVINKLKERGKEGIVDQFIMVAVPQVGTPLAIAGLLHGDEQSIPKALGVLLNKKTARRLGENMKSSYTLMPSQRYFDVVDSPVITFDESVSQIFDYSNLGNTVDSFEELKSFITASDNPRLKPNFDDIQTPNVLASSFVDLADSRHSVMDSWVAPTSTKVTQIAGWGIDTIGGIDYSSKRKLLCIGGTECLEWEREPVIVEDGDSTVVVPSAVIQDEETYYLNLRDHNKWLRRNRGHADILEVESLQELIQNLAIRSTSTLSSDILSVMPESDDSTKKLRFGLHSPVSIGITDQFGNYTGLLTASSSDFVQIRQEIPNSYYMEFGEGKYAGVTGNENYQVKLKGTGSGTFTFNIEESKNGQVIEKSFIDIPVATGTVALLTSTSNIASTTLKIDVAGDGVYEKEIKPHQSAFNPIQFLQEFKQKVLVWKLSLKWEKDIILRIDKTIKFLEKNKNPKASALVTKYLQWLDQKIQKIEEKRKAKKDIEAKDLQNVKDQLMLLELM